MLQKRSSRSSARGRRPRGNHPEGRQQLLQVAVELFAERGIANTTVAQIAAAAKVTSAMVHYWFDTREKLLDAVVEECLAPVIRRFWQPAEAEHASALDLVAALLTGMLDVTEEIPWLASLWLREIVQEGGLLRERVLKRLPRDRNAAFRQKIIEAQRRGDINAQIAPELLFFSMLGLVMLPQSGSKSWDRLSADIASFDRAKLERHVSALLMHGLAGTSTPKASPRRSS